LPLKGISNITRKGVVISSEQIACECCDLTVEVSTLTSGCKAHCPRCGHLLSSQTRNAFEKATAFAASALLFLILSLPYPFLAFQSQGREQQVSLLQSGYDLLVMGFPLLALLLFVFILLIPAFVLIAHLFILLPLLRGKAYSWSYGLARMLFTLHPWAMAEVFLIGVLVSLVKIAGMADLVIGMSFWAYLLFSLCLIITLSCVDRLQLWHALDIASSSLRKKQEYQYGGAKEQGLQSCSCCGLIHEINEKVCQRCSSSLHSRLPYSIQRTWAFLITGALFYIPANLYPIMHTRLLGADEPSTILGGVVTLWQHGSYPIAMVIFVASVLIPVAKMLVLFWLAYSIQAGHQKRVNERTWMYRMTELIGRWSMIDVFVVAVLVSLVQVGELVSIAPGIAANAFAGVVILTMLSALSFDPRLIWDNLNGTEMGTDAARLNEPSAG